MAATQEGAGRTEGTQWTETLRPKEAAHYSSEGTQEGRGGREEAAWAGGPDGPWFGRLCPGFGALS